MNQRQFFQTAKKKNIPANVLKWIWENKETLLAIVALLFPEKKQLLTEEEPPAVCTEPKPTEPPLGGSVNGEWKCIRGAWTWIEDLG